MAVLQRKIVLMRGNVVQLSSVTVCSDDSGISASLSDELEVERSCEV